MIRVEREEKNSQNMDSVLLGSHELKGPTFGQIIGGRAVFLSVERNVNNLAQVKAVIDSKTIVDIFIEIHLFAKVLDNQRFIEI